ncbi:MAG TPA: 30S ribosomal protein S17 [Gammaproteobacteria bacterium]|nr:30S ribosomal protein S17 [Gammaproteobacteria bacterium]
MSEAEKAPRTLRGRVVSKKMDKSIAVTVARMVKHPVYDKYLRKSTKLLAHDENNECNEGDIVIIESSRPISKHKAWRLQKIVSRAQ